MYILSSSLMWLPLQHTSLQGPRVGMIFYKAKPFPVWMMHMGMFLLVFGDVRREAGRADGDGALQQDHGAAQETQLWALRQEHYDPCSSRRRSASGYTWVSPPASSTSSPPRPPPHSPPPSLTMPLLRRGLLCPTCRQVEIVCVALVNKEHSCRKLRDEVRNRESCAELEEEVARLGTLLVKGSRTAVRTMPL
ncbi:uncharacterized protein LOC119322987 [Triticum dicoccoides]|uniref:uncharacterized protein LOC119322987 n=1 Tax=Triticum dicoccoides TaxID=85692 RepID=UPI00188E8B27|nr:uncharacterized protein LOC119322987 [Triticum dicoccoides]